MPELHIIVDTREKTPWQWKRYPSVVAKRTKLDAGDYSILGYEGLITVERKSLPDLVQTLSRGRKRFEKECDRLLSYAYRTVIVEGTMDQIVKHQYRSLVDPNAIIGSICAIQMTYGLPFIFAGSKRNAEAFAFRWLCNAFKYAQLPA